MWKLVKLFFLLVLGLIAYLYFSDHKIGGATLKEYLAPLKESKQLKEAVREVRGLVGEGLKAAGEAISEDVTEDERKQMDNLVKQEMTHGTPVDHMPEGQKALPPTMEKRK